MIALQSGLGVVVFLLLAWALSEDRRRVPWRIVIGGMALMFVFAAAGLYLPFFRNIFSVLNDGLLALEQATQVGTSFVFGYLGGAPLPFEEKQPGASFVIAFRVLPLVLIVSALSALLYYWRVLPWIVQALSRLLQRSMGIGGALGVSTAANIFVGMVEAPLFIRPYLRRMSRFELFAVMVGGMGSIAGTMMVLYGSILRPVVPDAIGHILVASLLSAPMAIVIAALMIPPDKKVTGAKIEIEQEATSSMDAVTRGTLQGVELLLNIVAMLVVFVALVALANMLLGLLPLVNGEPLTFQRVLGWIMAPLVWLMGIPWSEAQAAGALMGTKTILNEFIAYLDMTKLGPESLSERSRLIMTYALCGFANLGSLGIMIGGLGSMVPERRAEIVQLGMRSIVAGTLATMTAAAAVGMLWRPPVV
jgi:concentrative nucleoside transporter, CNT family